MAGNLLSTDLGGRANCVVHVGRAAVVWLTLQRWQRKGKNMSVFQVFDLLKVNLLFVTSERFIHKHETAVWAGQSFANRSSTSNRNRHMGLGPFSSMACVTPLASKKYCLLTQARFLTAMQMMRELRLVPSPLRTHLPILELWTVKQSLPMACGCSEDVIRELMLPVRLHETANLHRLSLTTPQGHANRHRYFSLFF